MEKTKFFCCCCDKEIPYKSKAYSKNDGEEECPNFCSADCLCDYYDYYYNESDKQNVLDIFNAMNSFPHKRKTTKKINDAFWLNNDIFNDSQKIIFPSAKKCVSITNTFFLGRAFLNT